MTQTATIAARKGLVLALTCAAQFIVVLDIAIVNVALPTIRADLGFTQSGLQWVVVAYGLTLGGFLLLGGRLADHFGRRRILVVGLIVFTIASLIAGVAGQAELLIAARALQGLGAAMIPPAALSILAVTFAEGAQRNKALGLFGAVAGISATVGVVASGLLTDGPGWRWIFLINVPIGAALAAMALRSLPTDRPDRTSESFDIAGAVTVTGGLLLLVYGLSRGAEHGWDAVSTIGTFVASIALLIVSAVIEIRSRSPLIPAMAVRNRTLLAANVSAFFTFGAFFALIFVGTLLMQQVLEYSPTRTGFAWVATSGISFFAAALTGGKLAEAWGVRRVLAGGLALLAIALILLTRVPADAEYAADLLPAFLLAGIAVGAAAPAAQIGALSGVEGSMTGLASGLVETTRELGGAVGVAAVSTVLIAQQGLEGFHAAAWVIFTIAFLGSISALVGFPPATRRLEPVSTPQ
jgi:EmrB/QacA subfamily drug resistance transporter